ncbi:hypothetical protein FNF31_04449 [Cafeteria roenbergensis]|uniref:Uncharacterized protein n=2 Tax=Cafeteria roenbergensis TaxID=33653 RepID=A0A5A8D6G5_CAFRO|nr:hypothetical protein FNF31_04449 [Cafeteria roenbergensis]
MTVMAAVSAASLAAAQSAGALGKGSLGGYDVASVATRAAGEAATAAESRAADVDSRVRVLEQEVDAVDDELEHWRAERERLLDQLPAQERSRALTCVAGLRERGAAQWEGIAAADAIDALAARALDAKLAAAALLGPHDRAQAPAAPSPDDSMSPFAVTPLPPGEEDSFDDDSRDVPLRSTKGSAARFKGSSSSSSSSRLAWGHETSDPRD